MYYISYYKNIRGYDCNKYNIEDLEDLFTSECFRVVNSSTGQVFESKELFNSFDSIGSWLSQFGDVIGFANDFICSFDSWYIELFGVVDSFKFIRSGVVIVDNCIFKGSLIYSVKDYLDLKEYFIKGDRLYISDFGYYPIKDMIKFTKLFQRRKFR